MHVAALILVALAGIALCVAAFWRWRRLRQVDSDEGGWLWPMWVGLALLSAGLVCSAIDGGHRSFTAAVLGTWAAVASLFFMSRFLALPSRGLLALPIGGMVLLVTLASLAGQRPRSEEEGLPHWITLLHVGFMAGHTAAALLAGAGAAIWLLARSRLKHAEPSALKLPSLPLLERVTERALVASAALLIGGLATGGMAIGGSDRFALWSPPVVLALLSMALLVVLLFLRAVGTLNRRSLSLGALAVLTVTALAVVSTVISTHGM